MQIVLLCLLGLLAADGVVSRPSPQFEHLIIPYEEAFVPSVQLDTQNEPEIWTSYNVGVYRGGDTLEVPLGASYRVAGPPGSDNPQKLFNKRGSVFSLTNPVPAASGGRVIRTKPGYRPGIVL